MSHSILSQLDNISRVLESQQKRYQQHPEFFNGKVIHIQASAELLKMPDFHAYLVPFCFQLRLSLSIIKTSDVALGEDNIISENIKMIERLGVPVLHSFPLQ